MRLGFLLLLLLLLPADGLHPQTVEGRVLESGSERPIPLAQVFLLDTAFAVVDRTFSDHDGAFRLQSSEPGSFFVRAGAMGYRTKVDGVVELADGGVIPVAFFLIPEPVPVEGVEVEVERRRSEEFLQIQGFYERREEGFGQFITPDEIRERQVRDFQRLFQKTPIEVAGGLSGTVLRIRGRCPRDLLPSVYVNGALVDLRWDKPASSWADPEVRGGLEEVVWVADILAVEIYAGPATTPLQWSGSDPNRTCGTVVIWTKGGG